MVKAPRKIKDFEISSFDDNGKETKKSYQLVEPTAKQIRESRWHYSVVFSQALRDGLMTERQMSEFLTESSNVLSQEDTNNLASLYLKAQIVESEMNEEQDLKKKENLAVELKQIRAEVYQLENTIRAPYYNTAEQRAEESRIDFLLQFLVRDGKDSSLMVWPSKQDYEEEQDYDLVETSKAHLLFWMHNLDENWEKNLPENQVLDEIEKKRLEDSEKEEELEEEKEGSKPKNKPKTTRKKTTRKKGPAKSTVSKKQSNEA